jgi:hypothetical protein
VLVQDKKVGCTRFPPQWNDVARDAHVLMQDGKLARVSFPHIGMMLFEMHLCLRKIEILHALAFPPEWNDVFQDARVLLQEGKLSRASFMRW